MPEHPDHKPHALTDVPNVVSTELQRAVTLLLDGGLAQAEQILSRTLKAYSSNGPVINQVGLVYLRFSNFDAAKDLFKNAVRLCPELPEYHYNLGNAYHLMRKFEKAMVCFQHAHDLDPNNADYLNNLAGANWELGNLEMAEVFWNKALVIKPDFADLHNNLGNLYVTQGRAKKAETEFLKAIDLDREKGEYYRNLTAVYLPESTTPLVDDMMRLFDTESSDANNRIQLGFALGAVLEHQKKYDSAFECFLEANRLHRDSIMYSHDQMSALVKRLKSIFDADFLRKHASSGNATKVPIFILGMPRSGTSLVEQILASHPDVVGAGELNDLKQTILNGLAAQNLPFPNGTRDLKRKDLKALGGQYLKALRKHSKTAKHITDKMPVNFLYIGFIKLLLPEARIIHIKRNAMDNCVSLFTNYFEGNQLYAYDLEELGSYYCLYEELMDHWRTVAPGQFIGVEYESLVENSEPEIRRLLEFCGLPFDEACLSFYKSERPVHTASVSQVRKPMYKTAVQRWKRYEKQLEPLRKIIENNQPGEVYRQPDINNRNKQ